MWNFIGLPTKVLDLLLIIIPWIIELFKKKRGEDEKISQYVRKQQEEKLKTYDALLKDKADELTKLSQMRIATVRAILTRVRSAKVSSSSESSKDVHDKGA